MTVTSAQVTTLLENVLFESATLAKANATQVTAYANLSSSTSTVAGLSAFLATQPEASIAEQVVRYYQGALGRVPAPVEIAYYVAIAEANMTSAQISEGATAVNGSTWATIASYFAASPEFKADFGLTGATTNEALVITGFYHNILGRAPTAAELTYYEGLVNTGTSYSTLVQYFTESPEYQTIADSTIESNLAASGTAAVATVAAGGNPLTSTTPIGSLPSGATGNTTTLSFNSASNTYIAGVTVTGTAGSSANTLTLNDGAAATAPGTFDLSLPAGGSISNIQTLNINGSGTDIIDLTASSSAWSSVTAVNITSGAAQAITVGAGASVTDTDTLSVNTTAALATGTTIDGGSSVTLTATGTQTSTNLFIGNITIGGNTAPTGAVTVTVTETLGTLAGATGNVSVYGGANVTVTDTVNSSVAIANPATGTAAVAANTAAAITVGSTSAPTAGTVNVTANTNVTATLGAITVHGDSVTVVGGTTVAVTENATQTQALTVVGNINTVDLGAVSVTGGSATTSVTVTQAAANATGAAASAAVAAVTGVNSVTAVTAGPGVTGVAAVVGNGGATSAAVAAVTSAPIVVDGAVTIVDANYGATATANTITTVSVDNFASALIQDNALTTLTLAGTGGVVTLTNGYLSTTNNTLTIDANNLSATSLVDTNSEITTLDVVTGGTKGSALTVTTDTALKTLNVSGTEVLTFSDTGSPLALKTVTVTGAAGFTGSLVGTGVTAFAPTSTGVITATLTDTTQTFTGGAGQDIISLAGDATKAITGGSATNNEVELTAAATTYTAANFGTNVTHFQTLGADDTAASTDSYNLHTVFTGYTGIDVITDYTSATFTGVAAGTTMSLDTSETAVSYVLYTPSSSASLALTLNTTTAASTPVTIGSLTLNDSNGDGLATLNVTSNAKASAFTNASTATQTNIITTLHDTSLSAITITGNAALNVGTISLGQPGQAVPVGVSSFSITDNSTGFDNTGSVHVASTIGSTSFTDDTLGSLSFAGTNSVTMADVVDNNAVNLTIANTGTGTATLTILSTDANGADTITTGLSNLTFTGSGAIDIGTLTYVANSAALSYDNTGTGVVTIGAVGGVATTTSVTLAGDINFGGNTSVAGASTITLADTAGVTFAASTDNGHINVTLTGATGGVSTVVDAISVGNGNDYIKDGSLSNIVNVTVGTGSNDIILGAATTDTTALYNVTLGTAHTGVDLISVGTAGTAFASAANLVLTTALVGDQIVLAGDVTASTNLVGTGLTAGAGTITATSLTGQSSVAGAISALETAVGSTAEGIAVGVYAGNTYIVESNSAVAASGTTTTVIELMGVHTVSTVAGTAGGVHLLTVAS